MSFVVRFFKKTIYLLFLELIRTDFNLSKSSNVFPVPLTTQSNGSVAIYTGISVFSLNNLSKFCIKAPPPANTIPFYAISDASSGGVFSSVAFTTSIISFIDSSIAN